MTAKLEVGNVFGKLTLVRYLSKSESPRGKASWLCKCSCGREHVTDKTRLTKGISRRCRPCSDLSSGESRRCAHHSKVRSKEYSAWSNMKNRCLNPSYYLFHRYGGRGISVCDSWLNSFVSFHDDMGSAPSKGHSLDRIDNEKGYSISNCRWATEVTQSNNRSDNVLIDLNGKSMSIADWCRELGLNYATIQARLKRGTPHAIALTKGKHKGKFKYVTPDKEFDTVKSASEFYGVKLNTASNRFSSKHYKGWDKVICNEWLKAGKIIKTTHKDI